MKFLATCLLVAPALSVPTQMRILPNSCPVEDIKNWIESNTGIQVPAFVQECLTNGSGCPSIDDIMAKYEQAFGTQLPSEVIDCLNGGNSCPTIDDVLPLMISWQSMNRLS